MEYQEISFGDKKLFDGKDRGPDYDIIFPESPKGKTILDIGCNIGYYSISREQGLCANQIIINNINKT